MRCPRNGRGSAVWRFTASQFAALLILCCSALAATAPYGVDLDGHPVMLAQSTAPAIVLFFTASDCPISNRYEPEMLRLEQKFATVTSGVLVGVSES